MATKCGPEAPPGQGESSQPLQEVQRGPIKAETSPQQAPDAKRASAEVANSCWPETWAATISTASYEKPAGKQNSPYAYKQLDGPSELTKDAAGKCVT